MSLVRSRDLVIFGQSYGVAYTDGPCYQPLMSRVNSAIASNPTAVQSRLGGSPTIADLQTFQRRNTSVSGSAILAMHTGTAGNYWLENDLTAGPLLTAATTSISGSSLTAGFGLHSQGEQEATAITDFANVGKVRDGYSAIWAGIRAVARPSSPTSFPIFVDVLGIRYAGQDEHEHWVRDAQLEAIASGTNIIRGCEKYALKLGETTHPARDLGGYAQMGAHTGRIVESWLLTGTAERGPSISSAVRTGNSVAVAISTPSGKTLLKPTEPDFFGFWDASGNALAITGFSWGDSTLTITTAGTPAKMRYPARTGRVHDITNIIRLSAPTTPIYTGEPGLVLQSAPAFTL